MTKVSALDRDEGLFGKVSYSMNDKARKFDIDGKTGEIYVVGSVDREGVFQYRYIQHNRFIFL